jgi:hypothetical protein
MEPPGLIEDPVDPLPAGAEPAGLDTAGLEVLPLLAAVLS